jgi:hypothetical protein
MTPNTELEEKIAQIFEDTSYDIETILLLALSSRRLRNRSYFNQQRIAIFQRVARARFEATPLVVKAIKEQYVTGSRKARQWLAAFFGFDMNQKFNANDQRAVELLVRQTLARLDGSLSSMALAAEQAMAGQALAEAAGPRAAEAKAAEAAKRLEEALNRAGVTTNKKLPGKTRVGARMIQINGRSYNAKKYSQLVIRTEGSKAFNQGMIERCRANRWDVVTVNATSAACNLCTEYDDGTYSLTGENPNYPVLGAYPPYHPGCQHFIEPAFP